jgi:hypothetical protein
MIHTGDLGSFVAENGYEEENWNKIFICNVIFIIQPKFIGIRSTNHKHAVEEDGKQNMPGLFKVESIYKKGGLEKPAASRSFLSCATLDGLGKDLKGALWGSTPQEQ